MDIGGEGAAGASVNTDKEYLRNGSRAYVWGTVSFSVFKFSFAPMLQPLDDLVQRHGNDTQDDNGCNHHIELEETGILKD